MDAHCKPARLGVALLLLSLSGLSACGPKRPVGNYNPRAFFEADFKKADTDQDEMLTRDEATLGMASVGQHFDEIDLDKNDRLNFAEVWSYVQWRRVTDTPPGKPVPASPSP